MIKKENMRTTRAKWRAWIAPGLIGGMALAAASVSVYRAALTPPEVAAYRAQKSAADWNAVPQDDTQTQKLSVLVELSGRKGSYIQKRLEQKANLQIQPVFIDPAAFDMAKPLMMAGGDVPDVLVEPDPLPLQRDVYHGFLMELPYSVILKYAPHYVNAVNDVDPIGWLYASCDRRNYGIPNMLTDFRYAVPGVWREDWLRRVGISKTPQTLDEMHEALKRFTFNDPDGDGRKDTWGMSGDVTNWWWASFSEIFGAYGVMPYDWMERNGHAVWGGTLPETKQALALLRQWYAEGLIHPDFVTDKSRQSIDAKFLSGEIGYVYYEGLPDNLDTRQPASLAGKITALNPKARLVPGAFPRGPLGKRGGRIWAGGNVIVFGKQMEKRPEVVIRVLKMLDAMITDENFYLDTHLGQRGVSWDYLDPIKGPSGGIKQIGVYTDANAKKQALIGSLTMSSMFPMGGPTSIVDKYTSQDVLNFNHTYRRGEWRLQDVLGKPDAIPTASEYLADLRNSQMTVFAQIIRGDRPLGDFDVFVRNWYARGGQRMTDDANQFLRRKQEIYRIVGATDKTVRATKKVSVPQP